MDKSKFSANSSQSVAFYTNEITFRTIEKFIDGQYVDNGSSTDWNYRAVFVTSKKLELLPLLLRQLFVFNLEKYLSVE